MREKISGDLRVHTYLFKILYCKLNLHNSSWCRSCLFPLFCSFFLAEVTLVYGYLLQKEQLGTHVPDRGDYQKVVIIGSVSSLFLMPSYRVQYQLNAHIKFVVFCKLSIENKHSKVITLFTCCIISYTDMHYRSWSRPILTESFAISITGG